MEKLAAMWSWLGGIPIWFLYLAGIVDVKGGMGILFPSLTKIQPCLVPIAALGCVLLQFPQ
ncbi:DoxX family protein [Pseudomonas simiae]|uniref:DoxX family protein n=1 Tax=Pseudomonas simiae TaxID=321846 RepID=UPI003D6B5E64